MTRYLSHRGLKDLDIQIREVHRARGLAAVRKRDHIAQRKVGRILVVDQDRVDIRTVYGKALSLRVVLGDDLGSAEIASDKVTEVIDVSDSAVREARRAEIGRYRLTSSSALPDSKYTVTSPVAGSMTLIICSYICQSA